MNSQADVSALLNHLLDHGSELHWRAPDCDVEKVRQAVAWRDSLLVRVANGQIGVDEAVRQFEAQGWSGTVRQVVQAVAESQPRPPGGWSVGL